MVKEQLRSSRAAMSFADIFMYIFIDSYLYLYFYLTKSRYVLMKPEHF